MSTTVARCACIRSAMLRPLSRGGEELGFDGGLLAGDAGGVGPVDPSAHPQGERVGLGLEHDGGAERDGSDRVGRQDRDLAQRAAGGGGGVDGEGVGGAAGGGEPVVPLADEGGQVAQVAGVVGAAEDELDLGGGEDGGCVVGAVAGADLGEGLEDRDDGEVLAAAVGEERGYSGLAGRRRAPSQVNYFSSRVRARRSRICPHPSHFVSFGTRNPCTSVPLTGSAQSCERTSSDASWPMPIPVAGKRRGHRSDRMDQHAPTVDGSGCYEIRYRSSVLDDITEGPLTDSLVTLMGPRRVGKSFTLLDAAAALCRRSEIDPRQVINVTCDAAITNWESTSRRRSGRPVSRPSSRTSRPPPVRARRV